MNFGDDLLAQEESVYNSDLLAQEDNAIAQ